jgi:hypothetical protein
MYMTDIGIPSYVEAVWRTPDAQTRAYVADVSRARRARHHTR